MVQETTSCHFMFPKQIIKQKNNLNQLQKTSIVIIYRLFSLHQFTSTQIHFAFIMFLNLILFSPELHLLSCFLIFKKFLLSHYFFIWTTIIIQPVLFLVLPLHTYPLFLLMTGDCCATGGSPVPLLSTTDPQWLQLYLLCPTLFGWLLLLRDEAWIAS